MPMKVAVGHKKVRSQICNVKFEISIIKAQDWFDLSMSVYFIYICINRMSQCKIFTGKGKKNKWFLPYGV